MTGQPYDCNGLGTAQVIQGNALNLPLPDNSVDACITSPPYFGLRSYQDAGAHYQGQLGSEATPAEFLDALIAATREMVRVLKPSGSIFVNLGDKYSTYEAREPSNRTKPEDALRVERSQERARYVRSAPTVYGVPYKSLMGIPWRYAIACIDQLGLILRAEIIWAKPNGLPESVQDRVRRSHEQWFHFTVQPRYFSAIDEIREEQLAYTTASGTVRYRKPGEAYGEPLTVPSASLKSGTLEEGRLNSRGAPGEFVRTNNPLGKLPGSVWSIPTQPLSVPPELGVDHFAAYPMEWPRRIIQGWTPQGICTVCGEGRRPVNVTERYDRRPSRHKAYGAGQHGTGAHSLDTVPSVTITGYVCGCPQRVGQNSAETRPAVVLDPFGGTGTTALVAKALGRIGITIDLSADYCRLAEWRCNDPGQLAQALQVEKPEPISPDQLSLFGEPA